MKLNVSSHMSQGPVLVTALRLLYIYIVEFIYLIGISFNSFQLEFQLKFSQITLWANLSDGSSMNVALSLVQLQWAAEQLIN